MLHPLRGTTQIWVGILTQYGIDALVSNTSLETLQNYDGYDGDGKENVKKSNRFNEQKNNSARASRFFVHFFAVLAQLRREMTKF